MTSGTDVMIRKGLLADISDIKRLVDQHKRELGFVTRPALEYSLERGEILVAQNGAGQIVGLVHYRHRRDGQSTLYNIVVALEHQKSGIGRELVHALRKEVKKNRQKCIVLKCPKDLAANEFYQACGFARIREESGKHRPLNVWMLANEP